MSPEELVRLNNIPNELKELNQWCNWRYEEKDGKQTKVPYQPNGKPAKVNDAGTYSSYNAVLVAIDKYSGIGFIFTDDDPFCLVDLDNYKQSEHAQLIYEKFNSYSEYSPSGEGIHIICKGSIPTGKNKKPYEIYSFGRFATMTGNWIAHTINDRQDEATWLWNRLGGNNVSFNIIIEDQEQKYSDEDIIQQAMNAENWELFNRLNNGDWESDYPSQSEADYAYTDIIQFYSKNRPQIERIFVSSLLGKRKKGKSKYHNNRMITRSFDKTVPLVEINYEEYKNEMNGHASIAQLVEPAAHNGLVAGSNPAAGTIYDGNSSIAIPHGWVGRIADYIYCSAPHPIAEIALGGALGLMAGICGRAFNISGTGLNQYILLLAETGMGKEQAQLGINKLINAINLVSFPSAEEFVCSDIASGPAILKYLSKKSKCVVSLLGEFGLRLEQMHDKRNSAELSLRRMLLDLYQKSAQGHIVRPTKYSDEDKNIDATIDSPAFSILGESVPSRVYDIINEDTIIGGLLPRFLFIEYKGTRPYLNKNHFNVQPSDDLVKWLAELVALVKRIMENKTVIEIRLDEAAEKLSDQFGNYVTDQINKKKDEVTAGLLNRAHLKALKLAGLIAIGFDIHNPIVTYDILNWALHIINNDTEKLSHKFESGQIGAGSDEGKQQKEVIRMVRNFIQQPWDKISKYTDAKILYDDKLIPYSYLNKRLAGISAFRSDRMGATIALKRTLQVLVDSGQISECKGKTYFDKYKTTQRAYAILNTKILEDDEK